MSKKGQGQSFLGEARFLFGFRLGPGRCRADQIKKKGDGASAKNFLVTFSP